jgi:hypothetical protein
MLRDDLATRWRALAWDGGPIWAAVLIGIMIAPSMAVIEGARELTAAEGVSRPADDSAPADARCRADNPFAICRLRSFAPASPHPHISMGYDQRKPQARAGLHAASVPQAPPPPASGERENTDLAARVDPNPPESPLAAMREVDLFNAYAHADAAPALAVEPESVDGYLFAAYRRLPQKRDASGDFTWKDPAAAQRFGLSLDRYVIGGMDPDFKELVYAAGKRMDADGVKWSILAGFRDDWRQQIASGFKASAQNSCHGGSRAVGGYGNGRCIDVSAAEGPAAAVYAWIDGIGRKFGLSRPMPGADPPHVATVGDWRAIAERLRAERLAGAVLATVRGLAGSDVADGLTELVTPPEMSITAAWEIPAVSDAPAGKPSATRVTLRRYLERKAGRHARLSCHRSACAQPAS